MRQQSSDTASPVTAQESPVPPQSRHRWRAGRGALAGSPAGIPSGRQRTCPASGGHLRYGRLHRTGVAAEIYDHVPTSRTRRTQTHERVFRKTTVVGVLLALFVALKIEVVEQADICLLVQSDLYTLT